MTDGEIRPRDRGSRGERVPGESGSVHSLCGGGRNERRSSWCGSRTPARPYEGCRRPRSPRSCGCGSLERASSLGQARARRGWAPGARLRGLTAAPALRRDASQSNSSCLRDQGGGPRRIRGGGAGSHTLEGVVRRGRQRVARGAMIHTMERSVEKLLIAYHRDGDESARDQVLVELMPLVRALAARYAGRGEALEDLVQVGSIGLIKAVDRFDIDRGVDISSYAVPTIVGEIRRHFRDKAWAMHVPRRLKELSVRLSRVLDQLTNELGRSPTIAELAQAVGVEEEEVIDALDSTNAYSTRSLHAPFEDGGGRLSRRQARRRRGGLRRGRGRGARRRGSRRARRARAADRRASILRGDDAVADRIRDRDLPDACFATAPTGTRNDAWTDRGGFSDV